MTIFELHLFGMTLAPTYYGLAYALGMIGAYAWIARRGIFSRADLDVLLYAVMVGILVGGRLGYVFFYNFSYYLQHPIQVLAFHEGGMSFHGGIIGVVLGLLWFAHSRKISLLTVSDEVAVTVPLGITLGRVANYLNNELYGFAGYTGPFAMVRNGISHFPSPLLEAVMEGIIL
jgi:phosphatidylglycerol:prolipoprotein diacylglycerol transferase